MKKLIYLSLVITLISSCKSSSFLKQRYTHFGHGQKSKVVVAKEKKSNTPKEIVEELPQTKVAVSVAADTPSEPGTEKKPSFAKVETLKNQVKHFVSLKPSNSIAEDEIESESFIKSITAVSAAKSVGKKVIEKNSAKAIVGKVLKIIILILTLAVILAVGALLILLGVIVI
jgi:hypothetical protein